MLKQKERLNREAFNRFFASGKRYRTPLSLIVYTPHTHFHASAVAPKKVFTTAVERNRYRRTIYRVFRAVNTDTPLPGVFICIAQEGARGATTEALRTDILAHVHKILKLR